MVLLPNAGPESVMTLALEKMAAPFSAGGSVLLAARSAGDGW
jgi:hypothetical protein